MDNDEKEGILLRKVDDTVDKEIRSHIRSKNPSEMEFHEIVEVMTAECLIGKTRPSLSV